MLKSIINKLQQYPLPDVVHFLIIPVLAIWIAIFIPFTVSVSLNTASSDIAPDSTSISVDVISPDIIPDSNLIQEEFDYTTQLILDSQDILLNELPGFVELTDPIETPPLTLETVEKFQEFLMNADEGYPILGGADGNYGEATKDAFCELEKKYGLSQDNPSCGIIGGPWDQAILKENYNAVANQEVKNAAAALLILLNAPNPEPETVKLKITKKLDASVKRTHALKASFIVWKTNKPVTKDKDGKVIDGPKEVRIAITDTNMTEASETINVEKGVLYSIREELHTSTYNPFTKKPEKDPVLFTQLENDGNVRNNYNCYSKSNDKLGTTDSFDRGQLGMKISGVLMAEDTTCFFTNKEKPVKEVKPGKTSLKIVKNIIGGGLGKFTFVTNIKDYQKFDLDVTGNSSAKFIPDIPVGPTGKTIVTIAETPADPNPAKKNLWANVFNYCLNENNEFVEKWQHPVNKVKDMQGRPIYVAWPEKITLNDGDKITCYFNNILTASDVMKRGSGFLQLKKSVEQIKDGSVPPVGGEKFTFNVKGKNYGSGYNENIELFDNGYSLPIALEPGDATITEIALPPKDENGIWKFISLECDPKPAIKPVPINGVYTVKINPGVVTVCNATNQKVK